MKTGGIKGCRKGENVREREVGRRRVCTGSGRASRVVPQSPLIPRSPPQRSPIATFGVVSSVARGCLYVVAAGLLSLEGVASPFWTFHCDALSQRPSISGYGPLGSWRTRSFLTVLGSRCRQYDTVMHTELLGLLLLSQRGSVRVLERV